MPGVDKRAANFSSRGFRTELIVPARPADPARPKKQVPIGGSRDVKLYTKTGDAGETGLMGGKRVPKDHLRVCAYGDVDETNATIGLAICTMDDPKLTEFLRGVQSDLFVLGAQLANPTDKHACGRIGRSDVERLEGWIDVAVEEVEPLTNFILPGGGSMGAGHLHHARTVCRRAERSAVTLSHSQPVDELCLTYLNRLIDLLFAWARVADHRAGVADIIWKPPSKEP